MKVGSNKRWVHVFYYADKNGQLTHIDKSTTRPMTEVESRRILKKRIEQTKPVAWECK